jgi:hypothetical protein
MLQNRHAAKAFCHLLFIFLLFGQACVQAQEEEYPTIDEESIMELAIKACPPGSSPSLTTVCNKTTFDYASGCPATVIRKTCPQPLEGTDCEVRMVLLDLPFDGGPKQRHNITCLKRQKCGPLKNIPPLSVSLMLCRHVPCQ